MAQIYDDLMDVDELSVTEISKMLGRSEAWVEHVLRLGDLPSRAQVEVEAFAAEQRRRDAALAEIGESTAALLEISRAYNRGFAEGLRKGRDQGRVFEMLLANQARVADLARHCFGASCKALLYSDGSLEIVDGVTDTATEERFVEELRELTERRRVVIRSADDPPPPGVSRVLQG